MEHVIITELSNGYLRLSPESGYALYCDHIQAIVPEAVVKSTRGFRAIPYSESPVPQTVPNLSQILDAVKHLLSGDTEQMNDEEAMNSAALFPTWISKLGSSVSVNERLWYNGKLYKVIQAHTVQSDWTPDAAVSLFVEVSVEEIPEWKQPTGAQDAYNTGDKVKFNGKTWESLIDANVWSPADYPAGWKEI